MIRRAPRVGDLVLLSAACWAPGWKGLTGIIIESCEKDKGDNRQKWKVMLDTCELVIVTRNEVSVLQAAAVKHRSTHT